MSKKPRSPGGNSRAVFFRSLGLLWQVGLPVDRCLDTLAKGCPDAALTHASRRMEGGIRGGLSLTDAMATCPHVFSPFHCEAIRLGESSGTVVTALMRLADREERSNRLQMRLKAALHYPCLIAVLCLAFVVLAPPLLFKSLLPLLQEGGASLPAPTRVFVALSVSLRDARVWLLGGWIVAVWVAGFRRWHAHPRNARRLRRWLLGVPVLGNLLRCHALAEFARGLSLQLEVGCDTLQAFHQAARCSQDVVLMQTIEGACQRLVQGDGLACSLASTGYFPPTFVLILQSGEECGDVVRSAARLANLYDDHLEHVAGQFAALVEPAAVMLLGGAAALTIVALVMPLLKLADGML
ncbi:type II secretion system F family protein [bacterium]|nr:type II secretion system F family protein [bacterium]